MLRFHKNDSIVWAHLLDQIYCNYVSPSVTPGKTNEAATKSRPMENTVLN